MFQNTLPTPNRILATLSQFERHQLSGELEPMVLEQGQILQEAGDALVYVYFSDTALVSMLTRVGKKDALALGLVGNEGVVGVASILGATVSPVRALVQIPGTALRMRASAFNTLFQHNVPLRHAVLQFLHTFMVQMAQTAACNHYHPVQNRLARWLLMTSERLSSDHFQLTHQFLSQLLGVPRSGITLAAQALKEQLLIDYSRGNVEILSHKKLILAACSCHSVDMRRILKA